jgi:hypothetical protein
LWGGLGQQIFDGTDHTACHLEKVRSSWLVDPWQRNADERLPEGEVSRVVGKHDEALIKRGVWLLAKFFSRMRYMAYRLVARTQQQAPQHFQRTKDNERR